MEVRSNLTTLCYIEKENSYLMLHRVKKKQDMNQDKWLGVGGHFEPGESPEDCLIREVKEETGLTLTAYRIRAVVTFVSDQYPDEYMFLYTAHGYEGSLKECSEGTLEWVEKSKIPQLKLWEGDLLFFQFLEDELPFFSLKLEYEGERLKKAVLNGKALELLEERNLEGEVTGRVQARVYMHRRGILHGTAHVWIIRPNEKSGFDLLLQKRSSGKDAYPGCYDISSAGHLEAGSDYMDSALRELSEELGIIALPEELAFIGFQEEKAQDVFYGKPFLNHEISRVYVCQKSVDEKRLVLQKGEVESVHWMDYEECVKSIEAGSLVHCLNRKELSMLGQWWKKEQKHGLS